MTSAAFVAGAARAVRALTSPLGLILVGLAIVLMLTLGWHRSHQAAVRAKVEAAVAQETVKIVTRDAEVREKAADERLADALNNAEAREEMIDALDDLPDARPSARRLRLACERLRRQGEDPLPAVCRSEG